MSTKTTETEKLSITKANVESLIFEAKDALEMLEQTCTSQAYKTILGYVMAKLLSNEPSKTLFEVGEIWDAFPKSASAMRQFLWDRKAEAPSKANDLAQKLMGKLK